MNQSDIFLYSEADAYTKRNAAHNARYRIEEDIVAQCIKAAGLKPKAIIDYGCSTGERLEALCALYGADGFGCDPSADAIEAARSRAHPDIDWYCRGLPEVASRPLDLIVTSFVLHWIDRDNLIDSMAAIDRQLVPGGHLVINDFATEADVPYKHRPGVTTFKRLYPEMFTATGLYEQVYHRMHLYHGTNEPCICAVLRRR